MAPIPKCTFTSTFRLFKMFDLPSSSRCVGARIEDGWRWQKTKKLPKIKAEKNNQVCEHSQDEVEVDFQTFTRSSNTVALAHEAWSMNTGKMMMLSRKHCVWVLLMVALMHRAIITPTTETTPHDGTGVSVTVSLGSILNTLLRAVATGNGCRAL